jgi:hypothetical protein
MTENQKPPRPFIPPESNEETRLYWDRLDAKFANIGAPAPAPAPVPPSPERADARAPAADPAVAPSPAAPSSRLIADAFSALLALEDGQPGARPVRLTTGEETPPAVQEAKITDAVIEDVVRRVIERLGPEAVRAVVTDVVSEISERLVKEEIERIRKPHV